MKKNIQRIITVFFILTAAGAAHPALAAWKLEQGVPTIDKLRAVHGYSASAVLAVGDYGTMVSYDGTTWLAEETVTDKNMYGVCFITEDLIYGVADKGRVLRFDGTVWSLEVVTDQSLRSAWGAAADDVFVAGENGTMLHFDGSAWKEMSVPTDKTFQAVWGYHGDDVYAVGGPSGTGGVGTGVMIHYDGTSWSVVSDGAYPRFKAVWGSPSGKIYIVGDQGVILLYDPAADSLTEFYSNNAEGLRGIWGTSDSNIIAVGDYGTILRFDGAAWTFMTAGTSANLFCVWADTGGTAFAAGDSGTIVRYDSSSGDDNGTQTCPFVLALNSREDVQLLRDLRDRRLADDTGRELITLFYRHAAEAARILQARPDLRGRLDRLIRDNRTLVKGVVDGGPAAVPRGAAHRAIGFIEDLARDGGREFKQAASLVIRSINGMSKDSGFRGKD